MDRAMAGMLNEMAKNHGVAWVGAIGCAGGESAGCAFVRRIGALHHKDGPGWWCAYVGVRQVFATGMINLDVHWGVTWEGPRLPRRLHVPSGLARLVWVGWDYAHVGDYTGSVEDDDGKVWSLEEIVEQELKGAVSQLRLGGECSTRTLEGRVVSPGEWIYGR